MRRGDWKITNTRPPFDPEKFELYDLRSDLAEINDLREAEEQKYLELLKAWSVYSDEIKVQFPSPEAVDE